MLLDLEKTRNQVETYNISSEDQITVTEIAQTVTQEMGLKDVEFKFTGGVDGGRGWKGDVKNMLRDFSRTKALRWKPKLNSQQTITKTVRHLITGLKPLLILISIFSHAWLPLLPELTNPLFTPNISMISSSKSLPRYSILKLYIAKWFWEEGIEYLQTENRGVTDIILKITYPTADPTHPTFSRVQRLGTISEKTPHDP